MRVITRYISHVRFEKNPSMRTLLDGRQNCNRFISPPLMRNAAVDFDFLKLFVLRKHTFSFHFHTIEYSC